MSLLALLWRVLFLFLFFVHVLSFYSETSLFGVVLLNVTMIYHKCAVVIDHIPEGSTIQELASFFGSAGRIESILLRKGEDGNFTGSAFVVYVLSTSVGKSVTELSVQEFKNIKLQIRVASEELEEEICKLMIESKERQENIVFDPIQEIIGKLCLLSPTDLEQIREKLFPDVSTPLNTNAETSNQNQTTPITVTSPVFQSSNPGFPGFATQYGSPYHTPKLPSFSGDGLKGDISYRQWRYHVQCFIQEGLNETSIMQAIRLSLRGTASEMIIYMSQSSDEPINSKKLLEKFDAVFGNALKVGQLYQQFYAAKQAKDESVVSWSCRLQKLYNTLQERAPLDEKPNPHMLRSIYFYGLTNEKVQDNNRHNFDSNMSFDELLQATRSTEFEQQQKNSQITGDKSKKMVSMNQLQTGNTSDIKMSKVLDILTSLDKRVGNMEGKLEKLEKSQGQKQQGHYRAGPQKFSRYDQTCGRCKRPGHETKKCYATKDIQGNPLK